MHLQVLGNWLHILRVTLFIQNSNN